MHTAVIPESCTPFSDLLRSCLLLYYSRASALYAMPAAASVAVCRDAPETSQSWIGSWVLVSQPMHLAVVRERSLSLGVGAGRPQRRGTSTRKNHPEFIRIRKLCG